MTALVQYACASAVPIDKQVKRQARAVSTSGAGGKKSIIDGYIVSTARTSNGTLTRVIDPPAIISFVSWTQPSGLSALAFGYSQVTRNRDQYMPNAAAPVTPVTPPGLVPVAPSYKYVLPAPASPNTPLEYTRAGQAWVDGQTVANVGPLRVTTPGTSEDYDALLYIIGLRWGAKLVPAADYTGLLELDAGAAATTEVLYVHARSIADAAGAASVEVLQGLSDVFRPSAYSAEGTTYVAIHARDTTADLLNTDVPLLLVGAMAVGDTQEVPLVWAKALNVGYADTPKVDVYVPDTAGLHVGSAVTLTSTVWDNAGWYSTKRYVLDKVTGATLSYTSVSDSDVEVYAPVSSSSHGLWMAHANRTPGAGYIDLPTATFLWTGTTIAAVDLDGWTLVSTLLQGFDWVGALGPNTSPVSAAVVQLSEGVLGVLACPAPSAPTGYDYGDLIPVHLLEVDEATLTLVADRGFIANASIDLFNQTLYRGFNITLVTPEKRDPGGAITKPAVLLCSYASATRLSTDGGATWGIVATGVSGYPYYRGNRLHPVKYGESL